MIQWQKVEHPAQIWGFLDLTELSEGIIVQLSNGTSVQKGVWAVIESCNYMMVEGNGERPSEIFTPIILDADEINPNQHKFYLVDVETFKRPLVVIPNIGTKREYLMMTPKAQWGTDFVKWLVLPHTTDEAEMKDNPAPELEKQPKKKKPPKKVNHPVAKKKATAVREEDSDSASESSSESDAS